MQTDNQQDDVLSDVDETDIEAMSVEEIQADLADTNETTVEDELTGMSFDGDTDDGSDPDTNSDELIDASQVEALTDDEEDENEEE